MKKKKEKIADKKVIPFELILKFEKIYIEDNIISNDPNGKTIFLLNKPEIFLLKIEKIE